MDDRDRRQIEVGAGLQESRLNTELIEWLQKWGPRALYVVLAFVLGYLGWTKWQDHRARQIDEAFAEYHASLASQNPDLLLDIATEQDGKASVWTLATLDAADLLVRFGRLGVKPGTDLASPLPEDQLSDAEQVETFRSAMGHYESVLKRHEKDPSHARFAQEARWGIVSAAISLGEMDRAKSALEEYVGVAEREGFSENLIFGRERLAMLGNVDQAIPVYAANALPVDNRDPGQVNPAPTFGPQQPLPQITIPNRGSIPIQPATPAAPTPEPGESEAAAPAEEAPAPTADPEPEPAEPGTDDPE